MDIVKAMQAFVTVVESGSLTAAADQLDTSSAAISRQLAALEQHLGARLLHRTTRRLSLSDSGQEFFTRAQQILIDIAETEAALSQHTIKPTGLLRVSAPLSFGVSKLSKWLPEFIKRYPELRIDIDLTDRVVDLASDGIDVAVRIARSPASTNVIARKIAPIGIKVCASPGYLARHGRPTHPTELINHKSLSYSYLSSGDTWHFHDADRREATIRVQASVHANNGDLLREMALADVGIIMQPTFIVADDLASGKLERLLPDWRLDGFNLYAVYLSRKLLSAKVRLFIDFLIEASGGAEL